MKAYYHDRRRGIYRVCLVDGTWKDVTEPVFWMLWKGGATP